MNNFHFGNNSDNFAKDFSNTEIKLKNKFYAVILSTFSVCLFLSIAIAFAVYGTLNGVLKNNHRLIFDWFNWFWIGFLIATLVVMILISFLQKMSTKALLASAPILIIYFGVSIGMGLFLYLRDSNWTYVVLAVFVVPTLITFVFGLLGYFNLVNTTALSTLLVVLLITLIVLIIVSIFIPSQSGSRLENWISAIGTAIIIISIILNFWMIRKYADTVEFLGNKEIIRQGVFFGLQTFIQYAILIQYIMDIFHSHR
ncbi:MAG0110 family membrane protein [Mycoplasma hafezii]|uniref:MAG0110 family membrane protein n=1 Tax=Mycoplasma hafezii TaxID=525886 RepID=UPI003CEF68DC